MAASTLVACGEKAPENKETKKEERKEIVVKNYPEVKKDSVSDDYFGTTVSDPYRWLENDTSAETGAWVQAQNDVTFDYLSQIPYRQQIEDRLTELWDYEKQVLLLKKAITTTFIRMMEYRTKAFYITKKD